MEFIPLKTIDYSMAGREFTSSFYPLIQAPPKEASQLVEFYDVWKSLCGDYIIPAKSDLTFEALKGWHSNIRIVELGEEITSPKRNLIVGEVYKQYWGNETMQHHVINADAEKAVNQQKYKEGLSCFLDYNYVLSIGIAPSGEGSHQKIAWMNLPLSNGENDKIIYLITALIPLEQK